MPVLHVKIIGMLLGEVLLRCSTMAMQGLH